MNMPVGELFKRMTAGELMMWAEYYKVLAVEREMERNRRKSQ